jgi:hypothetical protein
MLHWNSRNLDPIVLTFDWYNSHEFSSSITSKFQREPESGKNLWIKHIPNLSWFLRTHWKEFHPFTENVYTDQHVRKPWCCCGKPWKIIDRPTQKWSLILVCGLQWQLQQNSFFLLTIYTRTNETNTILQHIRPIIIFMQHTIQFSWTNMSTYNVYFFHQRFTPTKHWYLTNTILINSEKDTIFQNKLLRTSRQIHKLIHT